MRGADASAGTIKSGGKTRRAAKMVILDADHPDIEEFVWCKAIEERKARALRDAGFDMDLDGKDSHSIQYQNANNSVRVTDEFMQAVLDDRDWDLKAVTTGETVKTVKARELMRQISRVGVGVRRPRHAVRHDDQPLAHRAEHRPHQRQQPVLASTCTSTTRRATSRASTCSGTSTTTTSFDVEGFKHTVEVMFTAQEILVGNADYPTEKIAETSRAFRQLGLGYANLGALLMAQGMPYDSDERPGVGGGDHRADDRPRLRHERAHGRARMGPFAGYADNARADAERAAHAPRARRRRSTTTLVPAESARAQPSTRWDEAVELGERHGVRNSQATVLAPTGHDRPDDGLRHDRHRARPRAHEGEEAGRWRHDVHRQPDRARVRCAGSATRRARSTQIVAYIDEHKTIIGAPGFKAEHLPGVRVLDGRQHDPLHGSRQDDGRGAAVHQRSDQQDREHARRGDGRRASRRCTSSRGSSD